MSLKSEARAAADNHIRSVAEQLFAEEGEHLGHSYASGLERGFERGARWAVSRITPEHVAEVVKAEAIAAAITALYRGEEQEA